MKKIEVEELKNWRTNENFTQFLQKSVKMSKQKKDFAHLHKIPQQTDFFKCRGF